MQQRPLPNSSRHVLGFILIAAFGPSMLFGCLLTIGLVVAAIEEESAVAGLAALFFLALTVACGKGLHFGWKLMRPRTSDFSASSRTAHPPLVALVREGRIPPVRKGRLVALVIVVVSVAALGGGWVAIASFSRDYHYRYAERAAASLERFYSTADLAVIQQIIRQGDYFGAAHGFVWPKFELPAFLGEQPAEPVSNSTAVYYAGRRLGELYSLVHAAQREHICRLCITVWTQHDDYHRRASLFRAAGKPLQQDVARAVVLRAQQHRTIANLYSAGLYVDAVEISGSFGLDAEQLYGAAAATVFRQYPRPDDYRAFCSNQGLLFKNRILARVENISRAVRADQRQASRAAAHGDAQTSDVGNQVRSMMGATSTTRRSGDRQSTLPGRAIDALVDVTVPGAGEQEKRLARAATRYFVDPNPQRGRDHFDSMVNELINIGGEK